MIIPLGDLPGSHDPTEVGPRAGPTLLPYLVLLRVGFAVPRTSLPVRWALTPPFHPCRGRRPGDNPGRVRFGTEPCLPEGRHAAVCFLRHFPFPADVAAGTSPRSSPSGGSESTLPWESGLSSRTHKGHERSPGSPAKSIIRLSGNRSYRSPGVVGQFHDIDLPLSPAACLRLPAPAYGRQGRQAPAAGRKNGTTAPWQVPRGSA